MGGVVSDSCRWSDILLFNTEDNTVTKEGEIEDFKFSAPDNQCALTAPNQITAFVIE